MTDRATGAVLAAIVFAGCAPAPRRPTQPAIRRLALAACHVPHVAEALRCGTLDVPEDRAHPEGRHLQLPVIVVPGTGATGGTPLFSLAGGPGLAATSVAPLFATLLGDLRAAGDIVLVDQRGTGAGPSSLSCPELDQLPASATPTPEIVGRCLASLAPRADVRFYTTTEAARDLDDARRALGYDRVNLDALSYGTRLAQVYLRMYPEHVRAMVLYGALPMDEHPPAGMAEHAQPVLDAVIASCEHDAACHGAYPELRAQLAHLVPPAGVERTAVTEWIRHRLYNPFGQSMIPSVIARAAAGDYSFLSQAGQPGLSFCLALWLAVTCSEDIPHIDRDAEVARAEKTWFGAGRITDQLAECAAWPRGAVPPGFAQPVTSGVPVLVIAGDRDPATPPAFAVRVIARMSHAQLVHVPPLAHDPYGLSGADCLDRMELAFLRDPAHPVDTSCVANMAGPPFQLGRK